MERISPLCESDSNLMTLLREVKGTTPWGAAIRLVLQGGKKEEFRQLVEQLRSQAGDDREVMVNIIGERAVAALLGETKRGNTSGSCRQFV